MTRKSKRRVCSDSIREIYHEMLSAIWNACWRVANCFTCGCVFLQKVLQQQPHQSQPLYNKSNEGNTKNEKILQAKVKGKKLILKHILELQNDL